MRIMLESDTSRVSDDCVTAPVESNDYGFVINAIRCCGWSLILSFSVFFLVDAYAEFQGPDTFHNRDSQIVVEEGGLYIATGEIKAPDGVTTCEFEITSSDLKWYGQVWYLHAAGDCESGEIVSMDSDVKEVEFNPKTGKWEIIFYEDPGPRVSLELSGSYFWKFSFYSLVMVYLVTCSIGLFIIGRKYGYIPTILTSIPAIILPPITVAFDFFW